ncbi:hypothetical protein V6N12_063055 [Hibiscus sabdariffa]|uniref:Secreted protein n=1 Tax=Hibiscus sabdariffa TaxID=183260 RepID=A0ABR2FAM4_9ROSI
MMRYLLCLLAGPVIICSFSSGLEGEVLETVRPAGVLPFLWMEVSGMVRSAEAKVASVGASDSVGTSASAELLVCLTVELSGMSARCGVRPIGLWCSLGDCQSKVSFSSSDERCTSSVSLAFADGLADGRG